MPHERRTETSLYEPVKRYLEALGFTVKGEVCGCDLVALRGDEPPIVVIGELKLSFSLDLVLQAVDRTTACDEVWLAVGPRGRKRLCDPRVRKLCRFLGFGLLGVSFTGSVEVMRSTACLKESLSSSLLVALSFAVKNRQARPLKIQIQSDTAGEAQRLMAALIKIQNDD